MNEPIPHRDNFATTHWSVVLAAGTVGNSSEANSGAQQALEQLCQTYWYPLYVYVRRRNYSATDAEDLTQAFFAHLLQRETLATVRKERGKFRSFLLVSLRNFLNDEHKRAHAQKRGRPLVSLDATAESRFQTDERKQDSPEAAFERQWALQLLADVLKALEDEYTRAGKAADFQHLREYLTGSDDATPYAQLAERLASTEGAAKITVHRLRQRYRALLRSRVAETVATAEDIDTELRELIAALAR